MKVRQGYVSNSSSSSFVLFGTKLTDRDIKKIQNKHKGEDNFDIYESAPKGFEITGTCIKNDKYIGKCPPYSNGNFKKFEKRVNEILSDFLGRKIECKWLEMQDWS